MTVTQPTPAPEVLASPTTGTRCQGRWRCVCCADEWPCDAEATVRLTYACDCTQADHAGGVFLLCDRCSDGWSDEQHPAIGRRPL